VIFQIESEAETGKFLYFFPMYGNVKSFLGMKGIIGGRDI